MRLSEIERKALFNAIKNIDGEVFIFGSRVDENKQGGDIDILILTEGNLYEISKKVEIEFQKICDEKIDVLVLNPKSLTYEQKAFIESIKKVKIK